MIKAGILGIVAIIALALIGSSFGTIETGTRGVKYQYGVATEIVPEGVYFLTPFVNSIHTYDVRTRKTEMQASAASKDLQVVTTNIAVNYSLDPAKLIELVRTVGDSYEATLLQPAIPEAVKSTTAKYSAEELITKREEVRDKILLALQEKMKGTSIIVSGINMTNFDFSDGFNKAIERKVTAEQDALAAKNKKDQVQYEADQVIIKAKAEAESIRIQAESISKQGGAEYVQLKALEVWKGGCTNNCTTLESGNGAVPVFSIK